MGVGKLEDGLYHFQFSNHQLNGQSFINSQTVSTKFVIPTLSKVIPSSNFHVFWSHLACNDSRIATCNSVDKNNIHANIDIWHC